MGGTISCWSKVGEGTEFTVKMSYSLASDEQISVHSHRSETFEDQVLYGKNILVVEDNNINAEVIIELLNTKGMHSEWARDGQEAVEIFEARGEYHFQAILMDLMMPVKDGVEAAKEIRSLPMKDAEDIPIIALTADATEEARERINTAGMNYFVSKPIDHEQLFTFLSYEFMK
ncbi:MAG: response regulator [Lachnospiraceae bacterium]|nr:response regulator [Lachnospiraceae bacterium]